MIQKIVAYIVKISLLVTVLGSLSGCGVPRYIDNAYEKTRDLYFAPRRETYEQDYETRRRPYANPVPGPRGAAVLPKIEYGRYPENNGKPKLLFTPDGPGQKGYPTPYSIGAPQPMSPPNMAMPQQNSPMPSMPPMPQSPYPSYQTAPTMGGAMPMQQPGMMGQVPMAPPMPSQQMPSMGQPMGGQPSMPMMPPMESYSTSPQPMSPMAPPSQSSAPATPLPHMRPERSVTPYRGMQPVPQPQSMSPMMGVGGQSNMPPNMPPQPMSPNYGAPSAPAGAAAPSHIYPSPAMPPMPGQQPQSGYPIPLTPGAGNYPPGGAGEDRLQEEQEQEDARLLEKHRHVLQEGGAENMDPVMRHGYGYSLRRYDNGGYPRLGYIPDQSAGHSKLEQLKQELQQVQNEGRRSQQRRYDLHGEHSSW